MTAIHIAMVMGIKMIKSRADTSNDADVTYYVMVVSDSSTDSFRDRMLSL